MNKSEILEDYIKIMSQKELTKEAASSNAEESGKLYGREIDGDILDKAHPESCYIAPAYDRFNGLVENLKEQHAMMTFIATKPSDGKLVQRRYVKAADELMTEFIRLGFSMDARNEENLAVMADKCAAALKTPEFLKNAAFPVAAVAGIGIGLGALVGVVALFNASFSDNMQTDLEQARVALDEMFGDTGGWGWEDFENHQEVKTELEPLYTLLDTLKEQGEKVNSIKMTSQISKQDVAALKELKSMDLSKISPEEATRKKEELKKIQEIFKKSRGDLLNLYKNNGVEILEQYEETCKRAVKEIPEWKNFIIATRDSLGVTGAVTRFLSYVVNTDIDDAIDQLDTLTETVSNELKNIDAKKHILNRLREQDDMLMKIEQSSDIIDKKTQELDDINKEIKDLSVNDTKTNVEKDNSAGASPEQKV
jgi:hypothetical protein